MIFHFMKYCTSDSFKNQTYSLSAVDGCYILCSMVVISRFESPPPPYDQQIGLISSLVTVCVRHLPEGGHEKFWRQLHSLPASVMLVWDCFASIAWFPSVSRCLSNNERLRVKTTKFRFLLFFIFQFIIFQSSPSN